MQTDIDFAGFSKPGGGWRGLVLVFGIVLFAASVLFVWIQVNESADLERRLETVLSATSVTAGAANAEASTLSEKEMLAVAQEVGQLNRPLLSIIESIAPPKDLRIALLHVDLGGRGETQGQNTGIVRLSGEARSYVEMTRYVAYLAERPAFQAKGLAQLNQSCGEVHGEEPQCERFHTLTPDF
jgi:hypothetical protein